MTFSSKSFNNTVKETMRCAMTGPVNMTGVRTREQIDDAFDGFTLQQMAEWHMVHFGKESSTTLVISQLLTELQAAKVKGNAAKTLLDIHEKSEDTYRSLYNEAQKKLRKLENAESQIESEREMNHTLTMEIESLNTRVKELSDEQDRKARDNERL